MKYIAFILISIICISSSFSQTIEDPIFEKNENPAFHIKKVEITKDTTFVICSYYAEAGTWARISKETFLRDSKSHETFPLLRCKGLPYSPKTRNFSQNESCEFLFCFPSIVGVEQFDFIESEDENGFNIYGISLIERYDSTYSLFQYTTFSAMADSFFIIKEYDNAIYWKTRQLKAANYLYGQQSMDCARIMYELCLSHLELDESEKAINWGLKSVSLIEKLSKTMKSDELLAKEYATLMNLFVSIKDVENSIHYGDLSLKIRKALNPQSDFYCDFLEELVSICRFWGDYPKAIMYSEELVRFFNDLCFKDSTYVCDYVATLSDVSILYKEARNYEKSILYANKADDILESGKCNQPQHKIAVYSSLAATLAETAQKDGDTLKINKALELLEKAINVADENGMSSSMKKISLLLSMGRLYEHIKHDSERAISFYECALALMNDSANTPNNAIQAEIFESLADAYRGRDKNKHHYYRENTLEVKKHLYGEYSILYGEVLMYRSAELFLQEIIPSIIKGSDINAEDTNKSITLLASYVKTSSDIIRNCLKSSLFLISEKERNLYWKQYRELFDWLIPNITFFCPNEDFCSLAYDASLFSKGFMLESSKSIRNVMEASTPNEKEIFQKYNENIELFSELCNRPVNSVFLLDSLKESIREQEYLLSKTIHKYGFNFLKSNITWKDVQNRLGDKEVALEFVSYRGIASRVSPNFISALIIDNKCKTPYFVKLPVHENELVDIIKKDTLDEKLLSDCIWTEDILSIIGDAQNVYFSTSGILNGLGIEYLPIRENMRMIDVYSIYRLASTAELCNSHVSTYSKAALFGGLDYEIANTDSIFNSTIDESNSKVLARAFSERGGFDYLPNTMNEIKGIMSVLSSNNITCSLYVEKNGTEMTFKNLTTSQPNIIHFATHGMFVDSKDIKDFVDNQNLIFMKQNYSTDIDEDVAMSHSFLVLSGGNSLIHRDCIVNSSNDGILTAEEISTLTLKNLELVILSGCQTGLGEYSSEGVYGLQRAFKKAGANTIIMSLDKVDDEATRILMVEFYRNMMAGKSKYQSLKEAQKHLRQIENGKYDDPRFWASFIMMDGLD